MTATTPPPQRSRHICLTAYLLFLIITNGSSAIFLLLGLSKANNPDGHPIGWKLIFIGLFTLSMIAALGLWRWRRWGFWLYLFCSVILLALEFVFGARINHILGTTAVVVVLYALLHIGGKKNAWKQLG